jgi:hypothetical protein
LRILVPPFCGLSNFFPLIKKFGFDPKHTSGKSAPERERRNTGERGNAGNDR